MKKIIAMLLATVLIFSCCACGKKSNEELKDLNSGAWCQAYVKEAVAKGYAAGYDDGTYRQRRYITAGEFVKMLATANGADPEKFEARHWAYIYWEYLDQYEVFDGTKVTGLRDCLDGNIKRADAAVIINNMMLNVLNEQAAAISDPAANIPGYISLDKQYLLPVAQLYAKGILTGYDKLSFNGDGYLSRGEAATLIVRLFDKGTRTVINPQETAAEPIGAQFDSSTLFIGDALTYQLVKNYLIPNKVVGSASYMAMPCTSVKYMLARYWVMTPSEDNRYGVACNKEFSGLCYGDALAKNKGKYNKVFFLLGSNNSDKVTLNQYLDAIDLVLEYNPDATIYMQTVPDSANEAVDTEKVNGIVKQAVARKNSEGDSNIKLLDTNSAWKTGNVAEDGIHLTYSGLEAWYKFICSNVKIG